MNHLNINDLFEEEFDKGDRLEIILSSNLSNLLRFEVSADVGIYEPPEILNFETR